MRPRHQPYADRSGLTIEHVIEEIKPLLRKQESDFPNKDAYCNYPQARLPPKVNQQADFTDLMRPYNKDLASNIQSANRMSEPAQTCSERRKVFSL